MESLLLLGLASVGLTMANQEDKKNLDKTYNNSQNDNVKKIMTDKAKTSIEKEKKALELSEGIKEDPKKVDKELNQENPEFLEQFNNLSFNRIGKPGSNNETYNTSTGIDSSLQRSIELHGGFTPFVRGDMDYDVIDKKGF